MSYLERISLFLILPSSNSDLLMPVLLAVLLYHPWWSMMRTEIAGSKTKIWFAVASAFDLLLLLFVFLGAAAACKVYLRDGAFQTVLPAAQRPITADHTSPETVY